MPRPDPSEHRRLRVLVLGPVGRDGPALPLPEDGERLTIRDLRGDGHDLRDIVEAASRSDAAVLVAEAHKGFGRAERQTIAIAALAGIRPLVLAIHVQDGAEDDGATARIAADCAAFVAPLGSAPPAVVALTPDREAGRSALSVALDAIEAQRPDLPFRLIVDGVADGEGGANAVSGTVTSGRARAGDELAAVRSGRTARIVSVREAVDEGGEAAPGDRVTLDLDRTLDTGPGDVLAPAGDRPETCDQFAARLLWLDAEPLFAGRAYRMRIGAEDVPASVTRIKHRLDAQGDAPLAAGTLGSQDRGQVNLSLAAPVAFEPFERNRALGTFTLTDRLSGRTVAAGTIDFALRRAANIHRQAVDVTKAARAAAKAQRPALLWFTGLSGAGKSTIANLVEKRLFALGHHTYLLDGDNVRHGLNRDLGFTAQDRVENIRRVAETAKLMVDAGLITLASFISPFRAERRLARDLLAEGEFIEVFVDAPLGVAEARDPKGLYAQARAGRIPNFTGIDSPYEAPEAPELHLQTDRRSADDLADEVVAFLDRAGFLSPDRG